ncbi:MAG: hypothetical protein IH784_02105 [Bacteroidetes bacterium]|nr:hypothetical protein [Bacteroidota bacterium]
MKHKIFLTTKLLLTLILFLTLTVTAYSQDESTGKVELKKDIQQTVGSDVVSVMVEGTNICLGCTLKHEKGASAQCKIYGHRHTLKVEKAYDENGEELMYMAGWILHYLENDNSEEYIMGHHNDELKIKGIVYINERTLEVEEVES